MADDPVSAWELAVRWLLEQPDTAKLVRDAYFDSPLLDAACRYWRSEEWCAIRRWLPANGGRALDVGSGRGIAAFALAKEGFAVTALEPDPSVLVGAGAIKALAVDSGLPITVVQNYSERMPFEDHEFDILFARAALHHTVDLNAACMELFRVLRPGGRLVAVREHVISRTSDLENFLRVHPLHNRYGGEHAYLLGYYVAAITNAGFEMERVFGPLESVINFAPFTLDGLRNELATRSGRMVPGSASVVRLLLSTPGVWPVLRKIFSWLDSRPGRLYSFVAVRP